MTEFLRKTFSGLLLKIAKFLSSVGISPNLITILGVLGNCTAAYLIAGGNLIAGGLVVFFMGFLDAIDGAIARFKDIHNKFGALLDSVSDRYSEIIIFLGLLFYFLRMGDQLGVILVYLGMTGSVMVSYVRARSESLNAPCKVGIMTRVERYLLMVITLITGHLHLGLSVIAVLSHLTALHRIFHAQRLLKEQNIE